VFDQAQKINKQSQIYIDYNLIDNDLIQVQWDLLTRLLWKPSINIVGLLDGRYYEYVK
jgi:hypothetical protein